MKVFTSIDIQEKQSLEFGLLISIHINQDVFILKTIPIPYSKNETSDLNECIQNHIDQVQRMLPGGLNIQGIYITGDEILKKENILPVLNEIENPILFHRTKNGLQCFKPDSNGGLSTIELQRQTELPSITRFKTVVPVYIKSRLEKDIQISIQNAIDKFIKFIT